MRLPDAVVEILGRLERAGFEAYAVGGCVRDLCLGRVPKDYDITTNAKPSEVKTVFRHTADTGIAHGTVTVLIGGVPYEVTTYRVDGPYEDARHPSSVTFSADLKEDLARRDFTINAMAYHPEKGLVDLYGGREDLARRKIRCVGCAEERFEEDALRVLRALRFAAQLDFSIEEDTERAIRNHAPNLEKISEERIRDELMKLISSDRPGMIRKAYELGVTKVILPEFDRMMETPQNTPYHLWNVGEHTVRAMEAIEDTPGLRLTMLLHDTGKYLVRYTDPWGQDHFKGHAEAGAKEAEKILRRLKFDNDTIKKVTHLIFYHALRPEPREEAVRRAAYEVGPAYFEDYLKVQKADADAKDPEKMGRTYKRLREVGALYEKIRARGDCLSYAELAISGKDLIAMGMKPGKAIGNILESSLLAVLADPSINDRDLLLTYAAYAAEMYRE